MNKSVNLLKGLYIIGIPLFLLGIIVVLARSSMYSVNPDGLSFGITIDLVFSIPLVYLFLIRKTKIPKSTLIPMMLLGLFICSLVLPSKNQLYLDVIKTWLLPMVEFSIIGYVLYRLRKVVIHFLKDKRKTVDFYTALKSTCEEILPRYVVMPVVTEISIVYYGFIKWKKRPLHNHEFSYHQSSGTIPLLIGILLIIGIETFVLHRLVDQWSTIAAWIITFLSIYTGFQIFGFLKSMYHRPISIEDNILILRYGMVSETSIPLQNIEDITITSKDIEWNKERRKLSPLGNLESHNILIKLNQENILHQLYGLKKNYKCLGFYVDHPKDFKTFIEKTMGKDEEK